MLESLRLENFKGFEDHTVPIRPTTLIVGANNAGKSTIVEALRLVGFVSERFRQGGHRFVEAPKWLPNQMANEGLRVPVLGLPIDENEIRTYFYGYRDPPAILTARFTSGSRIVAYLGPEPQLHGVAFEPDGTVATQATRPKRLGLTPIAVQPLVAPLRRKEKRYQPETIERGDGTYLAPQHFRNQLWFFRKHFRAFKRMAEETWPGFQIKAFDEKSDPLRLQVRDAGFVGEVSLMGHGLQMWLQVMWFLARAPKDAIVVLDEPDVYMHPDIQRRLLELVRKGYEQLLIATHSVEIISDVDPRSILDVDRRQLESVFVTDLPGLQAVLEGIGTVQNVQLTRLMRAESFYLVEGEDVRLLRIIQGTVAPDQHPIDLIPHKDLGGRGGWGAGVPQKLPKRNADGDKIRSFAILDRDYYPNEEILERYQEARSWGIQLRIWSKKEIENYLLVPAMISRHIDGRSAGGGPTPDEVADEIDRIADSMKDEPLLDAVAKVIHDRNKKGGLPSANKAARRRVGELWKDRDSRWGAVSGKEVVAGLSRWSQERYGLGFGPEQLSRSLSRDDVHPELEEVLSAIAESRALQPPFDMPR